MSLIDLLNQNPEEYSDAAYRTTVHSHVDILSREGVRLMEVSIHQNVKYVGDFWGLLDDLKIPKKFHWLIGHLNGFDDSGSYDGSLNSIVIPDMMLLDRLLAIEEQ